MERIRTGALGAILTLAALTLAGAAVAQETGPAQDGGTVQRRIVIVPATPEQAPAQPAQPQQRIVIVPANPQPAPSQPAQPQQRIVIVPASPQQGPSQSAQPQQRIVIVPNPQAPSTGTADNASPPGAEPQHIVVVPQPKSGAAAQAQDTNPPQQAQPAPGESNPAEAAQGTGSGEAFHTFTAMPDVAPRDQDAAEASDQATPTGTGSETGAAASAPKAETGAETASAATVPSAPLELMPDQQHARLGPFLSGPGSLTFILHHTIMGAAGGFATQGISYNFSSDTGGKEAILAGTLVGAGIGFGTSAWWQFNHWIGKRTAHFGIVNSVSGGMFLTGLLDLTTDDPTALAWSSFIGSEVGAWLTAGIAGGDMTLDSGLTIASGQAWGAAYGALLLGIVRFSGSSLRTESALDTLFITQGAGAILTAFALGHFHPSPRQLLRADISGAVVGAAVLVLSALVMGHFDSPTPYALSMASSATTMALVSIFWDPAAEPTISPGGGGAQPYRSLW